MSKRFLSTISVLALVLAACGGTVVETTTTAEVEDPLTTTAEVPEAVAPDAQLLSYSLEAGTEFQYEVDLVQHIDMTAEAEGPAAQEEGLPAEATIDLTGSAVFTQEVADGPEQGTYEITITGEFTDLEISGTVDGVPIDSEGEIPEMTDLSGIEPIDVTFIVDEQGNLVVDGDPIDDPFAGLLGDMDNLGAGMAPGLDPGQFVGIPFTDEEVTVGDTWTEEIETPGLGEDPIVTTATSTVTGTDQIADHEVLVIETTTSTSPIEFDLAEFFIGLFSAFGTPEEADPEFDAMLEEIRFLFTIDDTSSDSVTRFDAEEGVVRQFDLVGGAHIVMDINVPDEETGELAGLKMDMTLDQELGYQLVSSPPA